MMRLYVNGVEVASRAQTGAIATSTNPLQIGGDSIYGQYFQGMIDEVRVYNVALTAEQIQTDMNTYISVTLDTEAPTAPGSLTATAVSGSQISLSWTVATDNMGVTGYLVESCQGLGCTAFAQIGTITETIYNDSTGLIPNTSYRYQVRATDAAGNLGAYSIVASATTQATISGLVAAYSFNEGIGVTAADGSGVGNTGRITNATWTSGGRYGNALLFNGTSTLVTVNDTASLDLTTGMTLEAWGNPSVVGNAWRDVIYKGNDNYYLEATSSSSSRPAMGGTFSPSPLYGTTSLPVNTWTHLAATYDGAMMRLY